MPKIGGVNYLTVATSPAVPEFQLGSWYHLKSKRDYAEESDGTVAI